MGTVQPWQADRAGDMKIEKFEYKLLIKAIEQRMQKLALDASVARRWPETAYPHAINALREYETLEKLREKVKEERG